MMPSRNTELPADQAAREWAELGRRVPREKRRLQKKAPELSAALDRLITERFMPQAGATYLRGPEAQ